MTSPEAFTLTAATTYTTSITVVQQMASSAIIAYDALPGNQPATYGNAIAAWDSRVIGYHRPPVVQVRIQSNADSGDIFVDGLKVDTPYIFGYAVGPAVNDVCASSFVASTLPPVNFSPSLMIVEVIPDAIIVRYDLPAGFDPLAAGSSVVLWQSQTPRYNLRPIAAARIESHSESGTAFLGGLSIQRSTTYTLAIQMTAVATSLAVSTTFST